MVAQEQTEHRAHLHAMWAGVAGAWDEHADFVDARGAQATERMLALTAPRPGERVLELACGAGGLGLAAAARVGERGEVVVSDVAAEMTEIAARRAGERGLDNVSARTLDLERIDEQDAAYDVVLCREGLMFTLEPERAVAEIVRVLRPGGRFAVAVWGPRERNPWLGTVLDAVSAHVGAPVPPPGIPGPFALEDAAELRGLFAGDELSELTVEEVPVPFRGPSFDDWWARTTALAGPLATILGALPPEAAQTIRGHAEAAARAYRTADGRLAFPGVTLLASGRRGFDAGGP
jgi:ubiquinone/menaquinone biosynthesis C-methylase UbiE